MKKVRIVCLKRFITIFYKKPTLYFILTFCNRIWICYRIHMPMDRIFPPFGLPLTVRIDQAVFRIHRHHSIHLPTANQSVGNLNNNTYVVR